MKHFEVGQWTDFARGLTPNPERTAMAKHISSGCRKCRRTAHILRGVAEIAGAESGYQVPQHAVHGARAIFFLQQPEKVCILPRIVGRLVYDSFREPLPAGLRARHRLTRHALYQAADYSLHVRLEHQRGTAVVALVGQIANQKQPNMLMANLPVLLVSGREIVAHAFSNSFGEFQFEYQPRRRLRLYIQTNQGLQKRIEVPLAEFYDGSAARKISLRKAGRKKD